LQLLPDGAVQPKDAPVWRTHIHDRCAPLDIVILGEHGLAGFCQGGIYRVAIGNRPVKFARQHDSSLVGDLKLHGYYCRDPLLYQTVGNSRERIAARCPGSSQAFNIANRKVF
jgi:hypothetical protein